MKRYFKSLGALLLSVSMIFSLASCELEYELDTDDGSSTVYEDDPTVPENDGEETTEAETTITQDESSETGTDSVTFDNYEYDFGSSSDTYVEYHFRNKKYLDQHFQKHGGEFEGFGYDTAEDYEKGASDVINDTSALHKTEKEDGDGVYYIEATNEFVVLSTDGYIRTYFRPDKGKAYYDKQ